MPAYQSPALPSPVDVPSQLLTVEVLRRPVESAQITLGGAQTTIWFTLPRKTRGIGQLLTAS